MNKRIKVELYEFPIVGDPVDVGMCRSSVIGAVEDYIKVNKLSEITFVVSTTDNPLTYSKNSGNINLLDKAKNNILGNKQSEKSKSDELSREERAEQYIAQQPNYTFDFLIVPETVKTALYSAIDLLSLERKIFEEWGLRRIEPFPRTALNFYGEPGTGKTLAAHALAAYLEKKILVATYSQIESKFHGDGPKNVDALFYAAQRDGAILFIDEADSLLSKRLTNVTQGSEQAINSMRSQLLTSLESFRGIVIFATNLAENYDMAFETRIKSVEFQLPDKATRFEIWRVHLIFDGGPPLDPEIDLNELSKIDNICGRDIKNAVIQAAIRAARDDRPIMQDDLKVGIQQVVTSRINRASLLKPNKKLIAEKIKQTLSEHSE